jgi:hypothetical protein
VGSARSPPFITITITSKVAVYAPAEWADTLTLYHLYQYMYSVCQTTSSWPVFPTGRFFGRKTQKLPKKNISGRTNLRPNFGRILPERAEMGRILKMFSFLYFFKYESIETLEFSQISVLVWFQN